MFFGVFQQEIPVISSRFDQLSGLTLSVTVTLESVWKELLTHVPKKWEILGMNRI